MAPGSLGRVLVVEDDERLARSVADALAPRCSELRQAGSVAAAAAVVAGWHPDLVILDVALPDGTAFDVLELLPSAPAPAVVAVSGEAGPDQSFELSQRGVRGFLSKPFDLGRLEAAVERAVAEPPALAPAIRQVVGKRELHEVEEELREVMIDEAMARADGSRRGAARLLGVSRQLLQHALRRKS